MHEQEWRRMVSLVEIMQYYIFICCWKVSYHEVFEQNMDPESNAFTCGFWSFVIARMWVYGGKIERPSHCLRCRLFFNFWPLPVTYGFSWDVHRGFVPMDTRWFDEDIMQGRRLWMAGVLSGTKTHLCVGKNHSLPAVLVLAHGCPTLPFDWNILYEKCKTSNIKAWSA